MAQLIPIKEWANGPNGFKYPPNPVTLSVYAKTGQIYPPAIKQGRRWVVEENAKFIGIQAHPDISSNVSRPARALLEKVINGSSPKTS
jgi:hypothetical protein